MHLHIYIWSTQYNLDIYIDYNLHNYTVHRRAAGENFEEAQPKLCDFYLGKWCFPMLNSKNFRLRRAILLKSHVALETKIIHQTPLHFLVSLVKNNYMYLPNDSGSVCARFLDSLFHLSDRRKLEVNRSKILVEKLANVQRHRLRMEISKKPLKT